METVDSGQPAVAEPAAAEIVVRKAQMSDIPALLRLINGYAAEGVMLPRTAFEMAENIRDFTVALAGGELAGCGALHFYGPLLGEVRSMAVDPGAKRTGVGRRLFQALETEARGYGIHSLFAFTYVPGFFGKLGFEEVDRGELPTKVWKDCLACPKFQCCDETAMVKRLVVDEARLQAPRDQEAAREPIPLPVIRSIR